MPFLPAVEVPVLDASSLRVHQFSRSKTVRLVTLLATAIPAIAPAAVTNYEWDGNAPSGGGNSRWSSSRNWAAPNTAPSASTARGLTNTAIIFTGNFKLGNMLDNSYFIRSLTFSPTAGAFTIYPRSVEILRLGVGGIINNSTNTQTLLTGLSLSNSQTWLADAGNLSIRGVVNLGANTLTLAGAKNFAITNTIFGPGALIKQGSGTLFLAGTSANSFSGGLTIEAGTVTVAKANALGTGPLTLTGGTLNLGNFSLGVTSVALHGGVINSSLGGISSSAAYQLQAGTINTRLGGAGGLLKTTAGLVTLTTANNYTGGSQITGGKLVVNNATGSGTGTGNVSVSNGGLLAGTGSISGTVTNAPGGTISAGNEIGVLNLGNTIWFGGATNRWDIQDATGEAGVGWDLLNITGTLTLNASSNNFAFIDVVTFALGGSVGAMANFDPAQNYLWKIAQTTDGIIFQPGESELSVFDLLTGNFINPQTGGKFGMSLSADGKQLNLSYTVPEPDRLALLGLGWCGFLYARRFKRNW